jgi:hypothetical protein
LSAPGPTGKFTLPGTFVVLTRVAYGPGSGS